MGTFYCLKALKSAKQPKGESPTKPRLVLGNPDAGMLKIFTCGIRNLGPWNPEWNLRNPESH